MMFVATTLTSGTLQVPQVSYLGSFIPLKWVRSSNTQISAETLLIGMNISDLTHCPSKSRCRTKPQSDHASHRALCMCCAWQCCHLVSWSCYTAGTWRWRTTKAGDRNVGHEQTPKSDHKKKKNPTTNKRAKVQWYFLYNISYVTEK